MTKQINYKEIIQQGIPLIFDWINKQNNEQIKENEDFEELKRVIHEIQNENDYSQDAYEDIRFVLRPFEEELSLKIKRLFNISLLDNYTVFISSRHFESIDDFIHLEMCTRRFKGNMTKFHYNPIPLKKKTRKFFTHLQTLFVYSLNDHLFKKDKTIIAREIQINTFYNLSRYQMNCIEQWTNKKCDEVVFDSDIHDWSIKTSVFGDKIEGRNHLIFLIEDEDGEKFGYYFFDVRDETNSFEFNVQSQNNRLSKPMKFQIKHSFYRFKEPFLHNDVERYLIDLGDIHIYKQNNKTFSYCEKSEDYNYYKIENALCGKTFPKTFNPKRIVVIQMK